MYPLPSLGTDVWGANTFPVRKYNSRTFHLKVRRSRLFRFFRRFPQINVGGDSARIPFVEHASRESRVALPPKGRLRHEPSSRAFLFENLLLLVVPTATICSSKGMIPLETIKRDMTTLGIIAKSLVISMGTNQTGKRFYQVKVKSPDTTSIKELGRLMEPLQMQAFRKTYGKILELTIAEVSIEAIASLTQYYDQPLRCFTFGDFQLVPTIEEFEEILGCPLGGRKPYLSSGCLPSLSRIATVVKDSARGLDRIKQTRNGIAGLPQKYLEDKARGMANQGEWVPFMDVLALLIFGVVLFPNVDGLVGLAAIDAFLAYHHSKGSPVVAVLADLFDTFDRRCEKSSARIICCLPALCVWLVSHLFQQDTRHPCPLLSHRSCTEKRRMDWDQLLAGIGSRTISWFPRWKEGKEGVLFSCGRYPNIPLVGTRGCINYNPTLAIRQLGYPMRGAPTEESMSPFLVRDLGAQNSKTIQRIHKAWETPLRKDQELRGIRNGIIGGYHEWLKVRIRGLDWLAKLKVVSEENVEAPEEDEEVQALKSELGKAKLAKEKFKLAATHVRKECAGLREENAITATALERETKRARKEEYGRNKFRGALWGSNNELKLRREERDQSRAHSMVLKEELVACSRSKRSLSQRLCETETNMLAIIAKYQEELGLATAHEHRIADEYAQVYAEKEARGRVIDSLHQEATMWMDRFALTLNGSQELPRLLAKAKAMADTYSAPEEIHGLLGYCQHMIDLMAHIIRNPDMSALKEQMASMMEAMLGMKQLMEKNAATTAAVSSAAEADPTLLATTHHPPSNIVGRGRDTLGHDGSPHLGYNRAAYPYGLPPNYSPPILQEDAGHIASPVHEKEPPQQPDEVHKDPQDYARRDVEFYPPIPEGPAPGTLPQPNIAASPIVFFADLVFAGERIEVGLKRGKFDYVSSTNVNAKRIGATGAKRKEGDAHAVSSTPAWVKPQQTPHGTHQYAQHHPSFSAHAGNASSSTPVQPKAPTQREAPQVPTPNTARPAGNSNTTRNFPPRPLPEFTPLPMTYEDLLPSLIANHLAVVTPGRVLEPPFPKWYDPNATCKYHGGAPGHSVEKCLALKYKVQHLMDAGWLTFQEDRPNVRTNPLANHGGGAVNAVESDRPHRSKPLRDVATPRRFIFEALQKGGVIPHSGCKEDSCLLHSGEMHDMETCLEVEELLQRMIDQGRLEVGIKGKEEQHICMQSTEGSGVAKPKPLVIYFTKSAASQKPGHPLMAKPVPFPYQNIMLGNGYEPGMGLGKDNGGITSLIKTQGNRGKYGLGYKPTQADMKRSIAGRKNNGQSSRWRQESEGSPPCHISRSFISAGLGDKGQVFAICEDDVPSTSDLVRPCPPDFQLGRITLGYLLEWRQNTNGRNQSRHLRMNASGDGVTTDRSLLFSVRSKQGMSLQGSPVSFEMAPRKLASKRSRKDKAAEGTSSAPEYDSHRFRSIVHQQRFEAIKGWSFLRERRVQLRDDEYTDFQEEIGRRRWAPLVTPMAKFDPEIVLEFYANAWPTEEGVRDMRSWVRGQWIPFDADAISQLLGYPMVLEEGQECEYGQRRNRSDGFDEEAIAQLLSTSCPPIIIPTSPCQSMAPTRHPLDPDKSNRALGFPALITGLCQSFGVPVAPTKVIRPPITRAFIEKYCTQRQAQGDAPQAAGAPPPPHQAGQAGAFDMEQYLRHLVRQQAANHRAHVRTHDCLYQMSLSMQSQGFAPFSCPTPDQFRAEVAWPGDWPEAQAGEAPPEAPGDGEEAHEDEEMADLLDFLGGSGDTGENNETFSSLTSYPELRRSEFLMGGYVGARASLLSTTPPFVAMTQELVARGDTLRLSAPFCHPEAADPMTSRDQVWSFCTHDTRRYLTRRLPMTSRDQVWSFCTHDTRRYLTVIRTLLSSRGGGPDDKQRPKAAGPMTSRDQVWSFCTHDTRRYLTRRLPMTSRDQVWSFCTHDTRRYLTVIRTLLSSRGGGPDDKQRPKAAGPMTSRDQVWSFCTHDTRRYLTVIRTLLSSRGGGPDDKQRPKAAGPMTSRDQVWSFCTHDTRRYLTVIRTFLSSRGGGPDDKQRPKAAGPMIRGDQVWSFCTHDTRRYLTVIRTLVSSRGGGPDDTRRYLTVIRTLLSSRGGGPDDKQRPSPFGPSRRFLQKAVASGGSNPARLGELSSPGRAGRQPPPLFCYK
ncbi:hypothetical protein HKD37_09G025265 [Glycine soja]